MKKSHLIFSMTAMAVGVLMAVGCSSDEFDSQSALQKNNNAITLTSRLQATRATADPQSAQIATSVKVGVFGVNGTTTLSNGDNEQYAVETNGDLSATEKMTWPTENSVNIYAYAPYQAGWKYNEANAFSVATDQSTDAGYLASDLLYGVPSQNPVAKTESAVDLSFTHKLAKINLTIQKAEGSDIDLSTASVTITNTKIATTLNPSTGALGEAKENSEADIKVVEALGTATTACALIVPQPLAAGTKLVKITIGSKTLVAKLGAATTFEGGESYNLTIKVGDITEDETEVTLKLGSTGIVTWGSKELGDSKLYATFGTPGGNASYDASTSKYTWTGSTNNLMNCFSLEGGKLANYTTLNFTFSELFSELSDGASVRINVLFSDNTNNSKSYYSAGTKATPISELLISGKTAADVTAIRFGGNSNSGSTVVKATEMYLE